MSLMDEFKEERDSIKHAPFKKKLEYFLDYYKWHTMGALFILFAIGIFIFTASKSTETVLYAMFFNTDREEVFDEEMGNDFLAYAGIEDDRQEALIDTSYRLSSDSSQSGVETTYQKLSIFTETSQLDVLGGSMECINICMYNAYLRDLRTILTEAQLEKYEPYFLYADEALLTARQEAAKNSEEYELIYPDPAKPEEMETPIPVAIDVSKCEKIQKIYPDCTETIAVGVSIGTIQEENVQLFIDYLFEK